MDVTVTVTMCQRDADQDQGYTNDHHGCDALVEDQDAGRDGNHRHAVQTILLGPGARVPQGLSRVHGCLSAPAPMLGPDSNPMGVTSDSASRTF
jgi:hypothetical protein